MGELVHDQERSYQSNDDTYKVEVNEFIMQSQKEGEYSTIEDGLDNIVEDIKEGIMIVKNQFHSMKVKKGKKNTFDKFITSMIDLWKLQKMKTYYSNLLFLNT